MEVGKKIEVEEKIEVGNERSIRDWEIQLAEQTEMRLVKSDPPYLAFAAWQQEQELICGCSTRLGGVSDGYLASLNLSYSRGDRPEAVAENFRRLAAALEIGVDQLVLAEQTHGIRVQAVGKQDGGSGVNGVHRIPDTDALVTDQPGLVLCVSVADCVPIYCFDPIRRVVGIAHAGWRGSVNGIADRLIEVMRINYGCRTADIRAAIGPSISAKAYEVDETVLTMLRKNCAHIESQHVCSGMDETGQHALLNLWELNRLRLIAAGLSADKVTVGGVCTFANAPFLFSHRATGGRRGNQLGFIGLR